MSKARVKIFIFICVCGFLSLLFKSAHLQLFQFERYATLSEKNRVKISIIRAPRGKIFDRNQVLLVDNEAKFSIYVTPEIDGKKDEIEHLSRTLGIEAKTIEKRLVPHRGFFSPVRLKRGVDLNIVTYLKERNEEFPEVSVEVEPRRKYIYGRFASHILGYVGEISDVYQYGVQVGLMGVESKYEGFLRGEDGAEYIEMDARGRELEIFSEKKGRDPVPGNDIYLTIDFKLQKIVEETLEEFGAGACVAMDPQSGEILAMLSKPNFDPNEICEMWESLSSDPNSPLYNRAISSGYPPGSVFKLAVAGCGLDCDVIKEEKKFKKCTGEYRFGRRVFKCWKSHGKVPLKDAIIQSCDIYFYQLGQEIGLNRLCENVRKYGFGDLVGVDLLNENRGLVPNSKWYDKKFGKGKWSEGVVLNLSIGQGEILVTPLQLVQFASAIGAGGKSFTPHIVKKIVDTDGKILYEFKPTFKQLPMSKETIEFLKTAMDGVVNAPHGTGGLARSSKIRIAGKTGTAENPWGEDHAIFCCYAPVENPRIALCLFIENIGTGGGVAAPLAKKILERYLYARN